MSKWKNKEEFKKETIKFAEEINISVKRISIKKMSRKWASCSTAGNLYFNSDLLTLDKKFGRYVIVHELLHFNIPNHGKLWKSLMHVYLGDYEKIENKLKKSNSVR